MHSFVSRPIRSPRPRSSVNQHAHPLRAALALPASRAAKPPQARTARSRILLAHLLVAARYHAFYLTLRHPFTQGCKRGFVHVKSHRARQPHQFNFMLALLRAAPDGDGFPLPYSCAAPLPQAVEENVLVWSLPPPLVRCECHARPSIWRSTRTGFHLPARRAPRSATAASRATAPLRSRADHQRLAFAGNHQRYDSLAQSPGSSDVICKRRPRRHVERVKSRFRIGHQFLRVRDAPLKFVHADRLHPVAQRLQLVKGGGQSPCATAELRPVRVSACSPAMQLTTAAVAPAKPQIEAVFNSSRRDILHHSSGNAAFKSRASMLVEVRDQDYIGIGNPRE